MKNIYGKIWEELEKNHKLPTRVRNVISTDYKEFAKKRPDWELRIGTGEWLIISLCVWRTHSLTKVFTFPLQKCAKRFNC